MRPCRSRRTTERLIGEILVTLGVLSKEDLIMAMEMYLMTTNNQRGTWTNGWTRTRSTCSSIK